MDHTLHTPVEAKRRVLTTESKSAAAKAQDDKLEKERRENEADAKRQAKTLHDAGWPWPLIKAIVDQPYSYLVVLLGGVEIICEGAKRVTKGDVEWVQLEGAKYSVASGEGDYPHVFGDRGLLVRLNDILICADGPS